MKWGELLRPGICHAGSTTPARKHIFIPHFGCTNPCISVQAASLSLLNREKSTNATTVDPEQQQKHPCFHHLPNPQNLSCLIQAWENLGSYSITATFKHLLCFQECFIQHVWNIKLPVCSKIYQAVTAASSVTKEQQRMDFNKSHVQNSTLIQLLTSLPQSSLEPS